MTIFSDNPHDRRMERLMMTVPNFAPRGVGFRFTEAQVFITATAATPTEILTATMRQIRCPPFRKRFNEYIESEENPMTYINEKHRARFELAAKNIPKANYALLSALYLLTADQRLWSCCKHHINNGCVFFENIKLHNCTERAYTLYLADRTNENNECWPAIPTIAADLKYSPSTVRRGIRDLKKAGLLETEQRYRKKGGKSSLLFRLKAE